MVMNRRSLFPCAAARRGERGDIMLVTMVFLLMCMLGLVISMRDSVVSTTLTGNNLARQKNVHISDIALRMLENQILAAYGGKPLEISAAGQSWYRDVPAGTAAPTASYWTNCATSSDPTTRCASVPLNVNGSALGYSALAVVQPTGRSDSTSCDLAQYQAVYYDLFVYVRESNGATTANTEMVYRICTLT